MALVAESPPNVDHASRKRKAESDLTPSRAKKPSLESLTAPVRTIFLTPASGRLAEDLPSADHAFNTVNSVHNSVKLNSPGAIRPELTPQPTSPSSIPTSQASQSSSLNGPPSTAPSSLAVEEDVKTVSPSQKRQVSGDSPNSQHPSQLIRSRSSSVASVDAIGRLPGRNRKPTSKAQALAKAGAKGFRNLNRVSDDKLLVEAENIEQNENPTVIENAKTLARTCFPETADTTNVPNGSQENSVREDVVTSVETPLVRSSPRQRKPTAKAAEAADLKRDLRKRSGSPSDGDRILRSTRNSANIPQEPSKLRRSLSPFDLESEDAEATIQLTANRGISVLPADIQHKPVAPLDDEKNASEATTAPEEPTTSPSCQLECLSPISRLLAFARFAAEQPDLENDDGDFETGLNEELIALEKNIGNETSVFRDVAKLFCVCSKKEHRLNSNNEAHAGDLPNSTTILDHRKTLATSRKTTKDTKSLGRRRSLRGVRENLGDSVDGAKSSGTEAASSEASMYRKPTRIKLQISQEPRGSPSGKRTFEQRMQDDYLSRGSSDETVKARSSTGLVPNSVKSIQDQGEMHAGKRARPIRLSRLHKSDGEPDESEHRKSASAKILENVRLSSPQALPFAADTSTTGDSLKDTQVIPDVDGTVAPHPRSSSKSRRENAQAKAAARRLKILALAEGSSDGKQNTTTTGKKELARSRNVADKLSTPKRGKQTRRSESNDQAPNHTPSLRITLKLNPLRLRQQLAEE